MLAVGFALSTGLLDICGLQTDAPTTSLPACDVVPKCLSVLCGPLQDTAPEGADDAERTSNGRRLSEGEGHRAEDAQVSEVIGCTCDLELDEMGNRCSCCASCLDVRGDNLPHVNFHWFTDKMGYTKVKDSEDSDDERTALFKGRQGDRSGAADQYAWEQHVLDDNVMKCEVVSKAAIISLSDGSLRAAAPRSFKPDRKGIKDILKGLQGDTSGLAERAITLGSGTRVSTPGKVDTGKAIYGTDGHGGGCTIFTSKECVLIVVYVSEPATATRLASEVAEYMADQGH